MGIFSRKNSARSDVTEPSDIADDIADVDELDADDQLDEVDGDPDRDEADDATAAQDVTDQPARADAPVDRSGGPFDQSEAPDEDDRLDLGAIALRPTPGIELRLDVDEQGQQITGLTAVQGDSALQLQAFAAPKSAGVWAEIRGEIADNLIGAGGTAEEHDGEFGTELHARMPTRGSDGRTTYSPVRFVGVDGPRWFLRGVLSGRAAVEDEAAAQLVQILKGVVVTRGTEARAPRELLELTIPPELLAAQEQAQQEAQAETTSADDLKPFERGPEITEVR